MVTSWTALKNFATTRSVSIHWIDDAGFYYIRAFDGILEVQCDLNKSNRNDDLLDFENK